MSVTTPVRAFKPGDRVHVKPDALDVPAAVIGRTYVVRKVNPKNVQADAADGGRGINFPAYALVHGDAPSTATVTSVPIPEFFDTGQVVTLKRPMAGTPADLPYVVFKDDGRGRVNVARLGGDNGRYVRVPAGGLVKRDLAWLADALVAAL
jgi:hypothetical protein